VAVVIAALRPQPEQASGNELPTHSHMTTEFSPAGSRLVRSAVVSSSTLAAFAGAALLLAGCGGKGQAGAAGHGGPGGGAMPPMPVAVRVVRQQVVPVHVEAVGQAEGAKEVEVRARVGGILERRRYREGEPVRAGAPMFTIAARGPHHARSTASAKRRGG